MTRFVPLATILILPLATFLLHFVCPGQVKATKNIFYILKRLPRGCSVVTEKSATDALARFSGVARLYVGVDSALRAVTRATCRLGVARLSAV